MEKLMGFGNDMEQGKFNKLETRQSESSLVKTSKNHNATEIPENQSKDIHKNRLHQRSISNPIINNSKGSKTSLKKQNSSSTKRSSYRDISNDLPNTVNIQNLVREIKYTTESNKNSIQANHNQNYY